MRLILKTKLWFSNYVVKVNKCQFRNFAKALSQEQTVGPNQETLTGALNDHELTKNERLLIIKQIDLECCLRLPHLSTVDILKMLNIYMKVFPSRITDFKFYKHSIEQLSNSVHNLAKKDLLQLIFYIGLAKKNVDSQTMMRQCIRVMDKDFIDSLSSEELCIICSATFKTSTKLIINKLLLEKVKQHIHNNLPVLNDCALFVTLIKSLRHNRYQDDNLLNTISYTIFFNKTFRHYSFPAICHILALFADYFYYDEKLFQMFTKTCLDQLSESNFVSKEMYLGEQLRGKDIKRFLWIMSMFSDLKPVDHGDIKDVIIPKLIERIRTGEFERDVDSLTDIFLFCWMLNYRPYELVPYVLNKRNLQFVVNSKRNLRLNLLLYAIYLEDPDLSKKLPVKPVSIPNNVFSAYQLHKRPLLQRLLNKLNAIRKEMNLYKFEMTQEIPHLNIIGITGYRNENDKAVYVEVLDDYNRVRNLDEDVPVGLMALKLRLLDRSEEGVLTVSQREVEDMTDADLTDYLREEIKLIY